MTHNKKVCNMFIEPKPFDNHIHCMDCGFSLSEHSTDIRVGSATYKDVTLNTGDVIRLMTMKESAFADAVIVGFSARGSVQLSRPYAYVNEHFPGTLLGFESFEVSIKSIVESDLRIDKGRTT